MTTQNEVATTKRPAQKTIKSTLTGDYFKQQVALCLPKHCSAERFIRVALTAIMRTPKLANCTEASVLKCMLSLSELGLEPDGRRAHLIPFENKKAGTVECTLIVDYKGLVELAMRSGKISKLHADLICDKDDFAFDMGDILHHRINWRESRGEPYAAYAMAVTTDGARFVQVMTRAEIERIRDQSQGWRAFQKGWAKQSPWQDSPGEMWKKTVFRRLAKWLPLSPELHDALDKEEASSADAALTPAARMIEGPSIDVLPDADEESLTQEGEEQNAAAEPEPGPNQDPTDGKEAETQPAEPAAATPQKPKRGRNATPQSELEKIVLEAGYTFDDFQKWGVQGGAVPNADTFGSFAEVPDDVARRMIKAQVGLLRGLEAGKGGEQS